ncbi:Phosphoinositide phosphatase SAC7 [Acorus calamus]|uniref:Phosphoinositide phosphatase SAC7 n=1 Tax=Acorus calamus TaxID=4465 RepID=A0AAV9DW35_ACOCL|nr:Phosphoinositide phosphatase SAC7 [Acorus calamus]
MEAISTKWLTSFCTDELPSDPSPKCRTVYGVAGMLKLIAGAYLLVITERECVGSYLGHPIFKVTSLQILPCNQSLSGSSIEQKRMETELSVLLSAVERTCGLYFSYDVNLTLSSQRLCNLDNDTKNLPLWRQADPRFLWNDYMLEVLIDSEVDRYLLPLVQGIDIPSPSLITIVHLHKFCLYPLFDACYVFTSSLTMPMYSYCMINTLYFICNLFVIFLCLSYRYFLLNPNGEKVEEQQGVVRTNCIDCLDRTNVTQSMIGRKMLEKQLQQMGTFGANDMLSAYPNFDASFKILWANHGDEISIQYSGTPALKGDFVRYGRRTIQGILNDGWNALARYYLNNFVDGTKQDAIDLLHGHYIVSVSRDMTSPFQTRGLESVAVSTLLSSVLILPI